MTINLTLTNPGTRLSGAALRPGIRLYGKAALRPCTRVSGAVLRPGTRVSDVVAPLSGLAALLSGVVAPRPGTRVAGVAALRPGIGMPMSALQVCGTRPVMRGRTTGSDVVFGTEGAVVAARPQADLPIVKQFRVPSSLRERSS